MFKLPNKLRTEIEDQIHNGYCRYETGETELACDLWMKAWDSMEATLTPGKIVCVDDIEGIIDGPQLIFNWVQDLETVLVELAKNDLEYAKKGIRFFENFLIMFPKEDHSIRMQFGLALAGLFFKVKEVAKGERFYLRIIKYNSEYAGGYVALAESWLGLGNGDQPSDVNVKRALNWLEKANSGLVHDGEDWDLDMRIEELRDILSNTSNVKKRRYEPSYQTLFSQSNFDLINYSYDIVCIN